MRKVFELTETEYRSMVELCRPVPYIVANGTEPIDRRKVIEAAWKALGEKYGFRWETAEALPQKGDRFFTAILKEIPQYP